MRSFGTGLRGFGLAQGDLQVEAGVAIADHVELTGQCELFRRILTNRLEQLIHAGVGQPQEQRLLDQAGGQVRDLRGCLTVARTYRVHRREVEAAGEHRHPSQQETLVLREEGVAPLHGGSQRPLRTVGPPGRLREEVEQVVEVPRNVLQVESDHPRRGQLDREREPVDASADLPDQFTRPIAVERSLCTSAGSLLKQADRVRLRQPRQPVVHLVHDPQRLSTRGEHVEAREPPEEAVDEIGDGGHNVLAVVEHYQDISVGKPLGERVLVRAAP